MLSGIECARARGGYAWWYVEAHDTVENRYGLVLILFAGAVFSPWYAARLRSGEAATGLEHPAVNLALYERPGRASFPSTQRLWVMNEHPHSKLTFAGRRIAVGESAIECGADGGLRICVSEDTTRFFGRPGPRLEATIRVSAPPFANAPLELGRGTAGEAHFWQPLVGAGAATVDLRCGPLSVSYRGLAYCDRNFGSGRLEDAFSAWSWAHGVAEGVAEHPAALVLYRAQQRSGGVTGLVVRYADPSQPPTVLHCDEGTTSEPPRFGRRGFLWLSVPGRISVGGVASERLLGSRLEDSPFYARHVTRLRDADGSYLGVGEYLSLDRFRRPAVQRLLAYKIRQVPT